MRHTALFFAYLFVCLAAAALLSVPLAATGWIDAEPQRILGRLAQVLILLGFWPLLRVLELAAGSTLGYGVSRRRFGRAAAGGWLLGVAMLGALILTLIALGVRLPDPAPGDWSGLAGRALQALVGGLLIGVLEETFFRGALQGAIRRHAGPARALAWSAALYAAVHFMTPGALPPGVDYDAAGALRMVLGVFADLLQWRNLDSLAALFLAGVLLALVRERTRHLGWCIGLHAGWVFAIQMGRRLTDGNDGASLAWLAGDYDGVIGWLGAAWIGGLTLLYWRLTRRDAARRGSSAAPA